MKRGFVVSAVLYPLLVIALALIMSILSMSDNRRKILENMKLEILEEENETESNMSNSELYFKLKALEESVEELNSRISEDRLEELENTLKSDYEKKINDAKANAKKEAFPVGSIFVSTKNTNPSTYIGGTWVEYGQGKTLVGVNTSETEFNTVEKTGGEKTHKLTVSEMPSHSHTFTGTAHTHTFTGNNVTTSEVAAHTHSIPTLSGTAATTTLTGRVINFAVQSANSYLETTGIFTAVKGGAYGGYGTSKQDWIDGFTMDASHSHSVTTVASTTGSEGKHTHTVTATGTIANATAGGTNSNTGGDTAHNNLQPYITVYFFKRTA